MPMTEYLNVGSQHSQNVQLNTPPFPPRSTATAAAGSASQLPATSPKDDSPGAAASTDKQVPSWKWTVVQRRTLNQGMEVTRGVSIDSHFFAGENIENIDILY